MHGEIDWQNYRNFTSISESDFLSEYAWVVLSSGMRESVIRNKFPAISDAFFQWIDASTICNYSKICKEEALKLFASAPKINAILKIAKEIMVIGFGFFKKRIEQEKYDFIQKFPYMGPATSLHLLKNLGCDVAKPDRHLIRFAAIAGYDNPDEMCEDISLVVGDKISVIDIVFWRYATLDPNYLEEFSRSISVECAADKKF